MPYCKLRIRSVIILLSIVTSFGAKAKICKDINETWVKFSDHVVTSIKYVIAMPKDKKVIVGTGVMIWDKPRGSIYRSSEPFEIKAYGIGALYIRSDGSGESFRVCVDSNGQTAITLYQTSF